MTVSILPKKYHRQAGSKLNPVQLRGFGGGWNAIDDDISMSPKYLVTQKNMHRTASGASEVRYGEKYFADVKNVVNGTIVDHIYFANATIVVMTSGEVAAVNSAGVATAIWNNSKAALLPGAPSGWTGGVTRASFVPFRDALVIHNGKDKAISISVALVTTYLQDLATGSNTNAPIGKYGCTVGNYHVVAGIPAAPTVVYIASKATAGTFPGDPAPNDAISFDVGAYAPAGATEIRGVAGFRQFLLVFFLTQTAIFTLGSYDSGGAHTPIPFDTLPRFGLLGQRCVVQLEKDMFLADLGGAGTATRNLFSGLIDTDRLSDVVGPEYQKTIGGIDDSTLVLGTFSVYDRLGNRVLLFAPGGRVFVYSENAKLRYKAWSEYEYAQPFTSACTTILGRVILAKGTRLYTLGNVAFGEKFTADLIEDRDADWTNNTAYTVGQIVCDRTMDVCYSCAVSHTSPNTGTFADSIGANPSYWTVYEGVGIAWEMELPWVVGKDPMQTKQNRFIGVLSKGDCPFTLEAYVDDLYKDVDGAVIYSPALSMDFVGNETPGFGNMDDQPFGGGRRSGDPRLWAFPVKFKSIKFRLIGNTARRTLQVIGITSLFSRGNYKRT